MKFEFEKNLVVSTEHISEEDNDLLDKLETSGAALYNLIEKFKFGWRIHVGSEPQSTINYIAKHFSPGLLSLIVIAYSQNCKWLVLDRDGPSDPNLLTYNW